MFRNILSKPELNDETKPKAYSDKVTRPFRRLPGTIHIGASEAVSLDRIADTLERMYETVCQPVVSVDTSIVIDEIKDDRRMVDADKLINAVHNLLEEQGCSVWWDRNEIKKFLAEAVEMSL